MTHYEFKGNVYYNGRLLNYKPLEYQDNIPQDVSRSDTFQNLIGYCQALYDLEETDMIFLDGVFIYQVGDNEPEKYDAFQECLPLTLCKFAYESDEKWNFMKTGSPAEKYYHKYLPRPFTTEKFKEVVIGKAQEKRVSLIIIVILIIAIGIPTGKYWIKEWGTPQEFVSQVQAYQSAQSEISAYESMSQEIENGNIAQYIEDTTPVEVSEGT